MATGQLTVLNKMLSLIKAFRDVDPEFPIQQAETLLWIALRPGVSVQELCNLTGMAQSSVSRNVAALGHIHRKGEPGYDMIDAQKDPQNPRRLIMFLTQKGRAFVAQTMAKIDNEVSFEAPTYRDWTASRLR
jgi:DNA-binding MarR family transcriptional regulator